MLSEAETKLQEFNKKIDLIRDVTNKRSIEFGAKIENNCPAFIIFYKDKSSEREITLVGNPALNLVPVNTDGAAMAMIGLICNHSSEAYKNLAKAIGADLVEMMVGLHDRSKGYKYNLN